MEYEIIDFIRSSSGDDVADTYERIFNLFKQYNVDDYILSFNEIYNKVEEAGVELVIQQFQECAETILISLLNQQGIFINLETPMIQMFVILDAVIKLQDNEDSGTILLICDNEENDEDKFSTLLEFVTTQSAEDYILNIDRINPGVIRNIKSIFSQQDYNQTKVDEVDNNLIETKSKSIKNLYSDINVKSMLKECKNTVVYFKLNDGMRFNLEFDFYINMLWLEISELNNAEIARDLLAIGIISIDKSEKALETVKEFISKNVADLDTIGKIIDSATKQFLLVKQDNGIKVL